MTFPPVFAVSGRVLDATGLPAARAWVTVSDGTGTAGRAWTHADGTFTLQAPAGDLTLFVQHGELQSRQPLQLGEGPLTGIEVRMGEPSPNHFLESNLLNARTGGDPCKRPGAHRQRERNSSRSTWRNDSIVTGADSGANVARKVALMRV